MVMSYVDDPQSQTYTKRKIKGAPYSATGQVARRCGIGILRYDLPPRSNEIPGGWEEEFSFRFKVRMLRTVNSD